MTRRLITPVILAGGSGTRLWPLSREDNPKQFCNLFGGESLYQTTLRRVSDTERFAAPIVLTNKCHKTLAETQAGTIGVTPAAIVCEPMGRDTAPAIALAALLAGGEMEDVHLLVLPSDHRIEAPALLQAAIDSASAQIERTPSLVTFGIAPDRPETGYGYLRAGSMNLNQNGHHSFAVEDFIEKPDRSKAERLIADNDVYWNAGIFLFSGRLLIKELQRHAPEVLKSVRMAITHGDWHGLCFEPQAHAFGSAPKLSIDYAVMEKTRDCCVFPVKPGWSDMGSWSAVWTQAESEHSKDGNLLRGDVLTAETSNSLIQTDGPMVGVAGLEDVVVVANRDAVLVTSRKNPQGVKSLVAQMQSEGRREHRHHAGEDRPWGRFDSLDVGDSHQVKRIKVHPGGQLSLQYHHHRAEHWIVVAGTARVTLDDKVMDLKPCEQVFIPQGAVHRLENVTNDPVEIIEVQYGNYLGEDDIVRLEDVYGRNADDKTEKAGTAVA
ncbi:mannose-1-phosphate guanylyltransferase/mannose-6-phosphate isomerase [Pelagibius sp. Alg239-R121]|uniref:mannose-1-phosphate guanylyltransferase/mannose-6-phosphate isomerase n=1 Tax=Pelagibius sp. Alg239-R121 TaxID=2993448 RepID=UPI0024A6934C|nr:mannose-1-phosphate guanylyltransferase/mannose-6-phosphate isomerase [Pelagibius sp. Alg239-R121]